MQILNQRPDTFDTDLRDYRADDPKEPNGRETDLGSMLLKPVIKFIMSRLLGRGKMPG